MPFLGYPSLHLIPSTELPNRHFLTRSSQEPPTYQFLASRKTVCSLDIPASQRQLKYGQLRGGFRTGLRVCDFTFLFLFKIPTNVFIRLEKSCARIVAVVGIQG